MIKQRYLTEAIAADLADKMVFIGGPRQVGKTTLAVELVSSRFGETGYFNWDNRRHRKNVMAGEWPGSADLIILDEIHKYRKWKTVVKGAYDVYKERYRFLITGSARLDMYRKGGDSMLGRYHYYRLHPFSLAELLGRNNPMEVMAELPLTETGSESRDLFETLMTFGGFPEPLMKQNARTLRRWHNERHNRLFREDIRDTEQIREIVTMQLLGDMLPDRVGSPLSLNSLREDLDVSHRAVSNWLNILDAFYYSFRIQPHTGGNFRSLKKTAKLYLWDWSEVENEGARFENCIAAHLLKLVHFLKDREGYKTDLYYLRGTDKKEVDFLVTVDKKPWFAVEAKSNATTASPHLFYFRERLKIPFCYQVVRRSDVDHFADGVRVVSADRFLGGLV